MLGRKTRSSVGHREDEQPRAAVALGPDLLVRPFSLPLFTECLEEASVLKKSLSDWSVAHEKTKTLRHQDENTIELVF
jgi:hypothetical protein